MRRLLRWAFLCAAAVSAALFALWAMSYVAPAETHFRGGGSVEVRDGWFHEAHLRSSGRLMSGGFQIAPPLAVSGIATAAGALGLLLSRPPRRVDRGSCAGCGYDLRATPEAGGAVFDRCPECGAVPAAAPGRKAVR